MVIEIRTAALQVLPLIAYVTKPQTGGLWIFGVPNKVTFYYRFPAWLHLLDSCSLRL